MKRNLSLIACVAISCAMMVSCRNTKNNEPTPEEIREQKQALADSVLAQIDALVNAYNDATSNIFQFQKFELTEAQKMVKPDYLLDPAAASTLVTRTQKINALAIYMVECGVRKMFDMPQDEVSEVIAKLLAEINYPFDIDYINRDGLSTDKIKNEYELCKERGDIASFWQFQFAVVSEIGYILVNNPDLFFNNITEEQWQAYCAKTEAMYSAIEKLAKYDEEMNLLHDLIDRHRISASNEDRAQRYSKESAKQRRIANKDKYIAKRNALLQ